MDPAVEAIISATAQIKNSIEQITETLKTWRSITIEITNHSRTFTLVNPRVYARKGYCSNPPQPTIEKGSKEVCTFSSTPEKPCDVYGVLTYQMFTIKQGCVGELAIMFSVPLKYTWHNNWFGVGIFHAGVSCDNDLFDQMYYNDGPFERAKGTGSTIRYSVGDAVVKGTMSAGSRSIMKIEFLDVPIVSH